MKKLTKLLALSGLALSLLVGCNANGGNGGNDKPGEGDVVKTLEGLEITAQPTKTSYYQGEEFDPAGLAVSAVYNTGKEALDPQAYTLSGFDSSTAGQKTITVTYEGKTQTITVNVIGKNGLSIDKEPEKYYVVGDELDLTGLVVSQLYEDGHKEALDPTSYEVSGFSSEEVGPVTVTVTYGEDTATIQMEIFAADWSSEDKADMAKYLIYEIPYYKGFELGAYAIGTETAYAQWFTATSKQPVVDDVIDDYIDILLEEKVNGDPILDDNGDPVLDDNGDPTYEQVSAWNVYEQYLTDDVDLLGFDENSDVIQFARWMNDEPAYFAFQIMSIGLDPEDHLLVAVTEAAAPLAGYGVGSGGGFYAKGVDEGEEYDMVKELDSLHIYGSMFTFGPASIAQHPINLVQYPNYDDKTVVFVESEAYWNPYIYANLYSHFYDTTCYTYSFQSRGTTAYAATDLATIKAKYDASVIDEELEDGSFSVILEQDGFALSVGYSFDSQYKTIDVQFETLSYDFLFRSDMVASEIIDNLTFEAYYAFTADGPAPIGDLDMADLLKVYPSGMTESLTLLTLFASADGLKADVEAALLETLDDRDLILVDFEDWQDMYTADATFKIGTGDQAANVSLELASVEAEYIGFTFDGPTASYVGIYYTAGANKGSLTLVEDYDFTSPTVFPARTDVEDGDYTGTWTFGSGDEMITLVIDENGFQFAGSVVTVLVEDENHNGMVLVASIGTTVGGGQVYYTLAIYTYEGVNVPYETWAEVKEAVEAELPDGVDPLPEELTHCEGVETFVLNGWDQGIDLYFDTDEHAAGSDLQADLEAGGFLVGPTINGQTVFTSPNSDYFLIVSAPEGNLITVRYTPDDPTNTLIFKAFEIAGDFDLPTFDDGYLGLDVSVNEEGVCTIRIEYEDAAAATASQGTIETSLATLGYSLEEGVYVIEGATLVLDVNENVITLTFTPTVPQE